MGFEGQEICHLKKGVKRVNIFVYFHTWEGVVSN
jgi:hypothetical protein